tara:strand:+ start:3392 stop:4021 length:630 start_codon:yes stop_codon:yes gene_type:complete
MKLRNLFLNISKFVLLLSFFSANSKLLADYRKNCPDDFPSDGTQFIQLDKNQFKLIITDSKFLNNSIKNEFLLEHITLLKLDVLEQFQKFIGGVKESSTTTKYGGFTYTVKFDDSWNTMKRAIVSMKGLGACIEKDRIFFSGEWSTNSIKKASRIIDLEQVLNELYMLEIEDPKFDIDKLEKKFPNILKSKDPTVLRRVINNWRKYRSF